MNSKQIFFFTNRDSGMFLSVSCILPQNVALISLSFGSCLHSLFGKKKLYIKGRSVDVVRRKSGYWHTHLAGCYFKCLFFSPYNLVSIENIVEKSQLINIYFEVLLREILWHSGWWGRGGVGKYLQGKVAFCFGQLINEKDF